MAPPAPPPPAGDTRDCAAVTPASNIPCNALLSPVLRSFPFSSPRSHSRPASHPDLAAAAQRLIQELSAAVSGNLLLRPLLSFPSDFRAFFEIRCRGSRVPSSLSAHNFAAILPGDSVAGLVVANGLSNFLNIYNSLLVVRLVLTWFPNSPPAIVSPLSTLCDPYLNIFRGIIPPLGGTLDLSPILAFLVLNAFTSTAAALPAELPATRAHQQDTISLLNLTTTQRKWKTRVCGKGSSENIK